MWDLGLAVGHHPDGVFSEIVFESFSTKARVSVREKQHGREEHSFQLSSAREREDGLSRVA